eukprot:sb/3467288/
MTYLGEPQLLKARKSSMSVMRATLLVAFLVCTVYSAAIDTENYLANESVQMQEGFAVEGKEETKRDVIPMAGTDPNKKITNQNSLFRSRDWLLANQGPVCPDSVGCVCVCVRYVVDLVCFNGPVCVSSKTSSILIIYLCFIPFFIQSFKTIPLFYSLYLTKTGEGVGWAGRRVGGGARQKFVDLFKTALSHLHISWKPQLFFGGLRRWWCCLHIRSNKTRPLPQLLKARISTMSVMRATLLVAFLVCTVYSAAIDTENYLANESEVIPMAGTDPNKKITNQNSLFRSRDWLLANQGPVCTMS